MITRGLIMDHGPLASIIVFLAIALTCLEGIPSHQTAAEAALQTNDRQPARLSGRTKPLKSRLQRNGPNQKWGADISYVWTREGRLYLAVVIDLFARRVVGWAAGDRPHKELALLALRRAVAVRCPSAGLIHYADRGSQYCSVEYQAELRKNGISISMSGKGNCFDNAMVETFFKTLKAELEIGRAHV